MEPYLRHYSCRPKSKSIDPTIRSMIDELQQIVQRLGEKVEGRCDNLELRVDVVEQRMEERFISLEMACVEADTERAYLDKHFSGLKLQVGRLNHFIERETMARLLPSTPANGPDGHHVESPPRNRELGFAHSHIPANGMTYPKSHPHVAESASTQTIVIAIPPMLSHCEQVMGNCLKSIFRCSTGTIHSYGILTVRTILTYMGWKSRFGSVSHLCMSRPQRHAGFSQQNAVCDKFPGQNFVRWFMSASAVTSTKL
jgi:hypothetical protein